MRDDNFQDALEIVGDPYVLVNMIWGRVQMLRRGKPPLIESFEGISLREIALREIIEGRITYVLGDIVVLDEIVGLGEIVTRKRTSKASTSPFANEPCHAGVSA